jgi:hypothetical protein
MDKVAVMPGAERADLFRETAERMGLPPALVEKDFWVCWTLKQLFSIEALRGCLMFKGGTSLSKVFGVINRFSEDVDLAVNYAPLGFSGGRDPAGPMSRNKRDLLLQEMMMACHAYIAGPFLDAVRSRWCSILGQEGPWALRVGKSDPNTVEFAYLSAIREAVSYVRPMVLLELGTHAELIPSAAYTIRPHAAEHFPRVFDDSACPVLAIRAERTFWEKATILHVEYHRPQDKPISPRYSRHYYDMALLAQSPVKNAALADMALLAHVVAHKTKFYAAAWARYELAVPKTLRLIPPELRLDPLRRDYEAMKVMVFGEPPAFDRLMESVAELEQAIRQR